jgi:hypothetical protein
LLTEECRRVISCGWPVFLHPGRAGGELEVVGTALAEGKKSREKPYALGLKAMVSG